MTWKIEYPTWQETKNQMEKQESNIRDLWDNKKGAKLHIIGIPKRKEKEKQIENIFEEMIAENFHNLRKETDIQVHGAQSPK